MKRLFNNRIITSNKYLSYLLLFLFILIIRFPFFFTDEFNWDESTYIIIGQWIVDGNLPYLEKTAIKPPLLYYLYALFVYFSFNELYLIRFYTCFLLLINLIFLNKIFEECFKKNFNFILITSFIFSSTFIIKDSNALFSENFAITFLVVSLYYFIKIKKNIDFFILGFFISCACLVRLNLGIVPIGIFIFFIYKFRNSLAINLSKLFLYIAGGIFAALLVFFPYIYTGNLDAAWNSIIISGSSMVENAPNSHFGALYYLLFRKSDIFDFFYIESLFRLIFWISSFLGLLLLLFRFQNEKHIKIIIVYLCITLSIFVGSRATAHYLILLNPICSVFCAYFFLKLNPKNFYKLIYSVSILVCLFISIIQYDYIFKNYKQNGTLYNGLGFDIYSYIKKNDKSKKNNIYIYKKHIAYWFLDKYPPTDIAHPSDINKEYLFKGWGKFNSNKSKEMLKILETKPRYLVLNKNISNFMENFFNKNSTNYQNVIKKYTLDKKFKYIHIYKNNS